MTTPLAPWIERLPGVLRPMFSQPVAKSLQLDQLTALVSATVFLMICLWRDGELASSGYLIGTAVLLLVWAVRGNYLHPCFLFATPWTLILFVSTLRISEYSRAIGGQTQLLVSGVIWLAVLIAAAARLLPVASVPKDSTVYYSRRNFHVVLALLLVLTVANIALAGYVPLLRGLGGGGTDYMDFGVPGIYGFYNAFANAFAVTSFALYLVSGQRTYLYGLFTVLVIFVLFVTRQNLISTLIEGMAVWALLRGRISAFRLVLLGCVALIAFDLIGSLRAVNIRELARISPHYDIVPSALIWLYAYAYFNILNLDNVASDHHLPLHDGSMFWGLLPSIVRPDGGYEIELEVSNFNVSSYLSSVYTDVGLEGSFAVTAVFLIVAVASYRSAQIMRSPFLVVTAAVLQFCCLFSFFVNFFFYLPIIFQIPIAAMFRKIWLTLRIGSPRIGGGSA